MNLSLCAVCGRDVNDASGRWVHGDRRNLERHDAQPAGLHQVELGAWLEPRDYFFLPTGSIATEGPIRTQKVGHDAWIFLTASVVWPYSNASMNDGLARCLVKLPWTEPIRRLPQATFKRASSSVHHRPKIPQPEPSAPPAWPAPAEPGRPVAVAACPRSVRAAVGAGQAWGLLGPIRSVGHRPVGHRSHDEWRMMEVFGCRWTRDSRIAIGMWEEDTPEKVGFRIGWAYAPDSYGWPWKRLGYRELLAYLKEEE